ncbi:MAG: hypothetical protein IJ418_19745 [Clostridia bacterium]|nr:hypothetical protein [Clostridia bacterium]
MAIRDSSYEGSFAIPTPKGVYQAAGDTNVNVEYAYRAKNMRTERGLLATAHGTTPAFPALGAPIETLTRFYRRAMPDDPDVFVAAAGGAIYTYTMGVEGWAQRADGFLSDKWSSVTYETSAEDGSVIDILIMSNAKDGMIVIYGDDLRVERMTLNIGDVTENKTYEDVRFAVLGRYAERIWGTGAPGYPDRVFYSKPYNPFDWTNGGDTDSRMNGGIIDQPTWDGDSFIALQDFGGYLLAIKPRTIFEIRGTDPSSFTITEAYGTDGPIEERTIATDRTSMLFLAQSGIGLYDGSVLRLLSRDALYETMRARAMDQMHLATACVSDHVYYMALPVQTDELAAPGANNVVIEYDTERRTFMLREGIRVKDFFALGGKVYYTEAQEPYAVYAYNDETARGYNELPMESEWETPWLDLGKAYMKRDFVLRFTADADEDDLPVEMTIVTNRREKTRTVLLQRERRDYRVKIQLSGVRVKLRVRSHARAAGWRIYGGVQVEYTIDEV